jgi:hypothetical protein
VRKRYRASVSTMATPNVTRRATSTKMGPSQTVTAVSGERTRTGSGPKATSAAFSRTSATPSIRRICISWGASMIRFTSTRWVTNPRAKSAAAQPRNPR